MAGCGGGDQRERRGGGVDAARAMAAWAMDSGRRRMRIVSGEANL